MQKKTVLERLECLQSHHRRGVCPECRADDCKAGRLPRPKFGLLMFVAVLAVLLAYSCNTTKAQAQLPAQPVITPAGIVFPVKNPPSPVSQASVTRLGNPGQSTVTYWLVANGILGQARPSGPYTLNQAANAFRISYALASGTYVSGIAATGTTGQTCTLFAFNAGSSAAATVALTGLNTIAGGAPLVFTNLGTGATTSPTSATAGNGTATCSGTAVIATTLGQNLSTGALLNWSPVSGALTYDVLRSPTLPTGACACAVSIGLTATTYVDTNSSTLSYTVNTADGAANTITMANQATGLGTSALYANGSPVQGGGVNSINATTGAILFTGAVAQTGNTFNFTNSGVTSINGGSGPFTFTGAVSCTAGTCMFTGGSGGSGTVSPGTIYSPAYYTSTAAVVGGVTPFSGPQCDGTASPPALCTSTQIQTALGYTPLNAADNLSDVADAPTSLGNLGGAPLVSPAFSGTPTAPTQSAHDDSTKLATTAYTDSAVALAGQELTYGNTRIGNGALPSITGSGNAAYGGNALNALTTGTSNTAIGSDALRFLADTPSPSDNNAAVGYNAGYAYYSGGGGHLSQATESVFLGALTSALANNDANETVIGYGAIGNGSNTITLGSAPLTNVYAPGATAPTSGGPDCLQIAVGGKITNTGYPCLSSLPVTIVQTNQSNTYTAGTQDFTSAAEVKVPAPVNGSDPVTLTYAGATYETQTAAALLAPLASPALTGTPTAPTQAISTNNTDIATTAAVSTALGSYLTTSAAASTYAPLASPALTGSPTAPTVAISTNNTSIATTAAVTSALGSYTPAAATNLAGGTANAVPYQTAPGATSFLSQGTGLLQEVAGAPSWTQSPEVSNVLQGPLTVGATYSVTANYAVAYVAAAGTVKTAATSTTSVFGIAANSASAGGTTYVCNFGQCPFVAGNAVTAGDFLIPSTTTAGALDDSGQVSNGGICPAVQIVGRALTTTTSGSVGTMNTVGAGHFGTSTSAACLPNSVASVSGTAPVVSSGGTTPTISVSNATTSAVGVVELAKDLGGTATTPEVVGVLNNTLPSLSTGFLNWTGSTWAFSPAGSGTVTSVTATGPIAVATGTTTPALTFAASVLNYSANGNGSTDNSTAFTNACAASTEVWLPSGAYAFTSNYTVTCALHFGAGATLVAPTGVTITLNGTITAPTVQIFTVAGTGNFLLGPATPIDYAEWWGITGTADNIGINAALAAWKNNGGTTQLLAKTYNLAAASPVTVKYSYTRLLGQENTSAFTVSNTTVLSYTSATGDILDSVGTGGACASTNIFWAEIGYVTVRRTVAGTSGYGVNISDNCWTYLHDTNSFDSISDYYLNGGGNNTYIRNQATTSIAYGANVRNGWELIASGVSSHLNPHNVAVDSTGGTTMKGFYIHGNTTLTDWFIDDCESNSTAYGIYIDGSGAYTNPGGLNDIHIRNCIMDSIKTTGYYFTNLQATSGATPTVEVTGGWDWTSSNSTPAVDIENSSGVSISKLGILSNNLCIKINGGGGNTLIGNQCDSESAIYVINGIDLIGTVGNILTATDFQGSINQAYGYLFNVNTTSTGNTITNSSLPAVGTLGATYGIEYDSTSGNNFSCGNVWGAGLVTTPISDANGSNDDCSGNVVQKVVSCSTSGTATFAMTRKGSSDKEVNIYLAACLGTASYTFPVAMTNTPQVLSQSLTSLVTAVSATATTVTGTTSTGYILEKGW